MIALARTQAKRKKLEDKETSFRVNKKPVNVHNIDRFLRRHEISEDQLLSMSSPVNGEFSFCS